MEENEKSNKPTYDKNIRGFNIGGHQLIISIDPACT